MGRILQPPVYGVQRQFPSLKRYGLAAQYFPRYRNRSEKQESLDVVLLSVIIRGRSRHLLGNEVHEETGGSLAITHYGQAHAIVTEGPGIEVHNVYLDLRNHPLPTLPEDLRATLSAILPIHPQFQHHLNRRVWMKIKNPERLAASLFRIEEEMDGNLPGALEMVQHNFQIFLIDVCRAAQRTEFIPSHASKSVFPAWVERLRQDLDRDFATPHNLRDLAKKAGVSVAYLCRLFKDYTGKPLVKYLVERRIQAALWKLREGDDKIISVALACGFNDLAYFNRTFKQIVGTTPSKYRQTIKSRS